MRPGVVTFVGSGWGFRKKEVDAMGHTVKSGSKAQLGLGITILYKMQYDRYRIFEAALHLDK